MFNKNHWIGAADKIITTCKKHCIALINQASNERVCHLEPGMIYCKS
jgi:hypothetical protein